MEKKKANKKIVAILKAGNGFTRRMMIDEIVMRIHVPFMYRIRISDPILSDRLDIDATAEGDFVLDRKTEKTAWYRLNNVIMAKRMDVK